MGLLGWVMMGLAIWHFTIFMPDRFWGGIVGAFVGSLAGAVIIGLIIFGVKTSSFSIPGESETDIAVVLYAVPARCWASRRSTSRASGANDTPPSSRQTALAAQLGALSVEA